MFLFSHINNIYCKWTCLCRDCRLVVSHIYTLYTRCLHRQASRLMGRRSDTEGWTLLEKPRIRRCIGPAQTFSWFDIDSVQIILVTSRDGQYIGTISANFFFFYLNFFSFSFYILYRLILFIKLYIQIILCTSWDAQYIGTISADIIIYNCFIFQCFISIDVVYLIVHANLPSSNVNLKLIFKPIIYFNNIINNIL